MIGRCRSRLWQRNHQPTILFTDFRRKLVTRQGTPRLARPGCLFFFDVQISRKRVDLSRWVREAAAVVDASATGAATNDENHGTSHRSVLEELNQLLLRFGIG